MWVVRHAQGTQNNKFAISLQYLEEYMKDGIDLLSTYKCQKFFQIDTIILGVFVQSCPNDPK